MASLSNDLEVAIVVPVLRDTEALAGLLDVVGRWPVAPREILVVAAEPDPELEALCTTHGCRYLSANANRGARLDRGARAAVSPVLWFLHADAAPSPHSLPEIAAALAGGAESGCFRFRFLGPRTWYKRLLERSIALRIRAGGVPYGDQGLFARREAYLACGGFAHRPLFEEVALVKRLRARGTFRLLEVAIGVSPRRWERDGWARRTLHNRWLALCHGFGIPAERLALSYRRPVRCGQRNVGS